MSGVDSRLRPFEQVSLVLLRTLIGWHFLYEGFYKLSMPGWGADGTPLPRWSSAGYLKAAVGPFSTVFRRMGESGWTPWLDRLVIAGLILVGFSLLLGLFTQIGCVSALAFLTMFYISSIPLEGVPRPGNEGTYLVVNKNLIELAAVAVLLAFRTGSIAGLDMLWQRATTRSSEPRPEAAV